MLLLQNVLHNLPLLCLTKSSCLPSVLQQLNNRVKKKSRLILYKFDNDCFKLDEDWVEKNKRFKV